MGFAKAVQNTHPEDREEYIGALFAYKEEGKVFHKARKLYKSSSIPAERLKWFEARERYSLASKLFHAAQEKYARATTMSKLQARGVNTDAFSLAKLAGVDLPLTLRDMLEETKRERAVTQVSSEYMENLKRINLAIMQGKSAEDLQAENEGPFTFGMTVLGKSGSTNTEETPQTQTDGDDNTIPPEGEGPVIEFDELKCRQCGRIYDPCFSNALLSDVYCSKKCERGETS